MNFLAILSMMMLTILCTVLSSVSSASSSASSPASSCSSPFGTFIGQHEFTQELSVTPSALNRHSTVKMDFFSNCNGDYVSNKFTYVNLVEQVFGGVNSFYSQRCDLTSECPTKVFSGMEWQCVNAGRLSLMSKFGAVFASIPYAANIFDLKNVTQFAIVPTSTEKNRNSTNNKPCKCAVKTANFLSFINNQTTVPPRVGDLLIYDTEGPGMAPTGHVCAVVGVSAENNFVDVVEENWSNAPWPSSASSSGQQDYSRRIEYRVDAKSGRQQLINEPYHVIGWIRVGGII